MRITNKDIRKEDSLCIKSPPKEEALLLLLLLSSLYLQFVVHTLFTGVVQRVFFKFIPLFIPLFIISVPQVRVNIREIERDTTFAIP